MDGRAEVAEGERVRAYLDCNAPHLYHVSSSVPMSCSQVLSRLFVGPMIWWTCGLWRAVAPPTKSVAHTQKMHHEMHSATLRDLLRPSS